MTNNIVYSAIRTPDGTLLESRHRHDYKTYVDSVTGEEYMIDGGLDYVRTNVNKVPATIITLCEDSPIEEIREYWSWGSYGKKGDEELHYILLKDMTNLHIWNILRLSGPYDITISILNKELQYREQLS